MKGLNLLYLLWFLTITPYIASAQEASTTPEQPKNSAIQEDKFTHPGYIEHPDWFKQTFFDLKDDVAEAAAGGKRVILYFYQDGCPYCKKLIQENLGQRSITDKVRANFDFIAINMWGNVEVTGLDGNQYTQTAFAEHMKVMFTPTILFLDEKGDTVIRLNGYYEPHKFEAVLDYVADKKEKEINFRDYYSQKSPVPLAGKLHQKAYYLQPPYRLPALFRIGKKHLMVMFEQKQCRDCDELHTDILERPESRELMDRFDIALVDIWSDEKIVTPDGKETTIAKWARELNVQNVPSMVFFDPDGAEVFRTEGYLKAFHLQSSMDYVSSRAYVVQPSFQRFISERAANLEALGIHVDIMK